MDTKTPKKASRNHWFLWWKINPSELAEQVSNYQTLRLWKSARGLAALCLLLSLVVTVVMAAAGIMGSSAYLDAGLFAVLALFIYLGHRWAMIAALLLWTLEKAFIIVSGVGVTEHHAANPVLQIIWWCVYMHAFYFAFRVEQERRRGTLVSPSSAANLRPGEPG